MDTSLPPHFRQLDPADGYYATWKFVYDSPLLNNPITINVSADCGGSPRSSIPPDWFFQLLPALGRCIDVLGPKLPNDDDPAIVMCADVSLVGNRLSSFVIESCALNGELWEVVVATAHFPDKMKIDCWGGCYFPGKEQLERLAHGHALLNSDIPRHFWSP
jgi:hypothetical protein